MDPSTPPAQDVQNQTPTDQSVNQVLSNADTAQVSQQSTAPVQPPQPKTQISVSGNVEEGSSVIIQESADANGDEEEELKVAPQETKTQMVSQPGGADGQEEVVEMKPSVPEFSASSPEVEKIVEKAPSEDPKLSQVVKNAGVTHSGPGVIDASEKIFAPAKMPVSFDEAVVKEKQTKLHDSKHWLMGTIMYIWRKLNPNIAMKKAVVEKTVPVKPVQTAQPEKSTTQAVNQKI